MALSEEIKRDLKTIYDDCAQEDKSVRERQIRRWRRLKLLWEGFQRIYGTDVAHDWRIWPENENVENGDQDYYDKPINVLRAYLESIIAALSVVVPPVKAYPEDATNPQDIVTARNSDKIAQLIYRHNTVELLWLHALFVFSTEGMFACYSYPESKKEYGTYDENVTEEQTVPSFTVTCPQCGYVEQLDKQPEVVPEQDFCPNCETIINPQVQDETYIEEVIKKVDTKPKTRICMKVLGGLYVKIGNYAKCQADLPYLIYSDECDKSKIVDEYTDELDDDTCEYIMNSEVGGDDLYGFWGRLSPQYYGEYPRNVLTVNQAWIRPCKYNILNDQAKVRELKKHFPDGVKVTVIADRFICAKAENLDTYWTISQYPLADYLHFEPTGQALVTTQDITNDLISLVIQTIEHGIGQTFVSPDFLNLKAYQQIEATPGGVTATKPLGNKKIADGFYEMKTAMLSGEVLPFSQQIQSYGQLTSGALPSLFGGQLEGSDTASEYSMSRSQALQRQQNTWKMLCAWWKKIFEKNIPMFTAHMKTDERDVVQDSYGNFQNVSINRSDLDGKIGKVELEANENLPMTWGQRADKIEKILTNGHPELMQIISAPENRTLLHEYLGMVDFYVPGEDDIIKQYDEIQLLLQSGPLDNDGAEVPSVEIDPIYDNHQVEFEIVRKWVISPEGREAKTNNPDGYKNVLLHGILHFEQIQLAAASQIQQQESQQSTGEQKNPSKGDGANPKKAKQPYTREAPITGDKNVQTTH